MPITGVFDHRLFVQEIIKVIVLLAIGFKVALTLGVLDNLL
jgi:hypothetical protein